jgi:hypothetical protein
MNGIKAVVIHRGGLAFYRLSQKEEGIYVAHLSRYDGKSRDTPPDEVLLVKEGAQWHSNVAYTQLVQDLGALVAQKFRHSPANKQQ